jgi:nitroreductase
MYDEQNLKEDIIQPGDAKVFFTIVKARHSVRKYTEDDIPHDDLVRIFEAARLAPSANNIQPWRFVVVKDEETKKLLAQPSPQRFIAGASAVVAVLGETGTSCCRSPLTWSTRDPIIATEHLVLAATALGYGACWIAVYESRPLEWLTEVRSSLNIPDGTHVICLVALGVPAEPPRQTPKKDLREIVFSEEYGKPLTG